MASRAGAVLLIGILTGGCASAHRLGPSDYLAPLFTYRADQTANSIVVRAGYGACDTLKSVAVAEQADSVTVSVTVSRGPELSSIDCQVAKDHDIVVTLKAPLGARKVIDAAGGETVPAARATP